MSLDSGYLYLNVANQWPGFALHQIVIASDGALQLSTGATLGVLMAGPVQAPNASTDWFRLRAIADDLPAGTHAQFFTQTSDGAAPPYDPTADDPFDDPNWSALPSDLFEGVIANPPGASLYIGLILRSDGTASPRIHQLRVDYGRDTYLTWLPSIYQQEPQREFLERFLALYNSVHGPLEFDIATLSRRFDAGSAPSDGYPSWIEWLSGWLAFDLKESWPDAKKRQYLADAFELYGWRGTIEGLRRYLKIYAGVNARIEEAGRFAQMWSLGDVSTLGSLTRLAPGALQGAVLGSSAIVDQARMAPDDDKGASIYEDVAHVFCVQVYASDLNSPGALDTVRQILDQEKPAHTVYQLSVIEPRMQVGAQARIGIDTIVAAGPPAAQLGMPLGGRALASDAAACAHPEDIINDTNIRTC
jgi:phage tail-like protein